MAPPKGKGAGAAKRRAPPGSAAGGGEKRARGGGGGGRGFGRDEELDAEQSDEGSDAGRGADEESEPESDQETADEVRLRLAKQYLSTVADETKKKEDEKQDDIDFNRDAIAHRLHADVQVRPPGLPVVLAERSRSFSSKQFAQSFSCEAFPSRST